MSESNVKIIKLPGHFAQVQLSGLKDLVEHHRDAGEVMQFDADEVERVDGAAVQFLLAVSQLQAQNTADLPIIINMNEVLNNAFDDMGVVDLIKTDLVQSSSPAETA